MVCPRGAVADFGMGPRLKANKQNVPTSPPVPLGSAEKEQRICRHGTRAPQTSLALRTFHSSCDPGPHI